MLGVTLFAGSDHRTGEQQTVNTYKEGEGCALHTVSGPVPAAAPGELRLDWELLGRPQVLPAGHAIGEPELLFAKIEDDAIEVQLNKLAQIKARLEAARKAEEAKRVAPQKDECTFEEFEKMDIRTATVLEAERVPKTDKLLKLTIDTGIDRRVIVSGIAEFYKPEDMPGKQICILANLKPRVIRGIESHGMILMAKQGDGKMRIVSPEEVVNNGAQVG
ncbi:MAG: methionine--tRNA ligase subunit beta [Bacteroidales bacterium]|nr:methionine--tRNA ligase subunit beta [Bacteroidales bacterium]